MSCEAGLSDHHKVAIKACQCLRAVSSGLPVHIVVTLEADLVGGLDRLPAIDAKFDQPPTPDHRPESRLPGP